MTLSNSRAFLRHMLLQQQRIASAAQSASGEVRMRETRIYVEQGGYFHEDGQYTEETSFVLVLIDADKSVVRAIAKDLCTLFHQESVLVTENAVSGYFIGQDA